MTRSPAENDHLPIYEDLVRERGDVVAEAQIAAAHTQNQATALLGDAEPNPRWDAPTGHQVPSAFG
ncbi:hypothetical protein EJ357_31435 [Streptomyces cyaneochromogenes]|uniref:Uncharacterized protein n=1 Tax=Streptomyces cyaneochromogenes TaxID=2496836 RepID=A0A3S9MDY8_9ACTN|nr:hypothetical protein [Streptomyces cyaneochromogenes]AZQ37411.1 hypothetical protein EJ357_31435 [Streptomyces cyaneochromogenes]